MVVDWANFSNKQTGKMFEKVWVFIDFLGGGLVFCFVLFCFFFWFFFWFFFFGFFLVFFFGFFFLVFLVFFFFFALVSHCPVFLPAMASSKKQFVRNGGKDVVSDFIQSYIFSRPDVVKLPGYDVLVRADYKEHKEDKVAIICGGGSGHEPAHFGFIGSGMLSGAVAGGVFASPSAKSVFEAIKTVSGKKGCLVLIKNYTGFFSTSFLLPFFSSFLLSFFPSLLLSQFFFSSSSLHAGDRLNFGLACERAREEGVDVEMVIIDDDAAIEVSSAIPGRFEKR